MSRIAAQLAFLAEADKLKTIVRRTPLADGSRLENSAEHSWHLALAAIVLREYGPAALDLAHVLELVTVHDLVEIYADDTFAYDTVGNETKLQRERAAADRLFAFLPVEQGRDVRMLWEEFEAQDTPEAQYANAIDRLQALILNAQSGGGSWHTHGVTRGKILERMAPVERALPKLWPFVIATVDRFCASGVIRT